MEVNDITISQKKLMQLASILPHEVLQEEYLVVGLSDVEIAYRNKDNQQPSLKGNLSEGSTTEESLTPFTGMAVTPALVGRPISVCRTLNTEW